LNYFGLFGFYIVPYLDKIYTPECSISAPGWCSY